MHKQLRGTLPRLRAAAMLAVGLSAGLASPAYATSDTVRLEGPTRYDTMARIVDGFPSSAQAVIATGENYPDALSASSLAGALGCPVILTTPGSLSPQARSELINLGVQEVFLMGGTEAVSDAVVGDIDSLEIQVTRIASGNRMDTSANVFAATRTAGSTSSTVIVASGYSFADALSIGPWAWRTASPILLTGSNGTLTPSELDALANDPFVKRVIIVGGHGAVSAEVESQLAGLPCTRIQGGNRYETSKAIAEWSLSNGLRLADPAVATGKNFPDALAGAALCGRRGSVLLLVSSASDVTATFMSDNIGTSGTLYVLGGEGAIPQTLVNAIVTGQTGGPKNPTESQYTLAELHQRREEIEAKATPEHDRRWAGSGQQMVQVGKEYVETITAFMNDLYEYVDELPAVGSTQLRQEQDNWQAGMEAEVQEKIAKWDSYGGGYSGNSRAIDILSTEMEWTNNRIDELFAIADSLT